MTRLTLSKAAGPQATAIRRGSGPKQVSRDLTAHVRRQLAARDGAIDEQTDLLVPRRLK